MIVVGLTMPRISVAEYVVKRERSRLKIREELLLCKFTCLTNFELGDEVEMLYPPVILKKKNPGGKL